MPEALLGQSRHWRSRASRRSASGRRAMLLLALLLRAKCLELRLRRIGGNARAEQPVHESELESVVAAVAGMVQMVAAAGGKPVAV